jgi:hypothetical protein
MKTKKMAAIRRLNVIQNHLRQLSPLALSERILFEDRPPKTLEVFPEVPKKFAIHLDIDHDQKLIEFETENMSVHDKINIFLKYKEHVRQTYPTYIVKERHD